MTRDEFARDDRRAGRRAGGRHHRATDRAEGASRAVRCDGATPELSRAASARGRRRRACAMTCDGAPNHSASAGRVHFLGARRDLGNILAAIDIFVMPSLLGRPAAVAGARHGRRAAGDRVACRRHSRSGERRRQRVAGDAWRYRDQLAQALARLVHRHGASRSARQRRRSAFVLPRFGVDGYVASITGLYDRLLAANRPARDARHPVSHAVLADRRRRVVGSRRLVRALRGFARAVLRRDRAVGAGIRHAARPRDRACARPTSGWRRCRISQGRVSSTRCCRDVRPRLRRGSISAT